ncbi:MAG: FAD-dependent oxidoreductase, partial [Waterburya sp.]
MRDFAQIQQTDYDVIIIGGGINGAGVARDAALRGLKTILIEK